MADYGDSFPLVSGADALLSVKDARIAELEAGGTAYDAGYQAAKADMWERVYKAEAALAEAMRVLRMCCDDISGSWTEAHDLLNSWAERGTK